MEQYVVMTELDGEQFMSIKNERELAHLWRDDNEAGVYDRIRAWRFVDDQFKPVNVYELACEVLRDEHEMEQEYEDYCETVNEYGYDYYEDQDQLEMGFNPYMGCYDDDC